MNRRSFLIATLPLAVSALCPAAEPAKSAPAPSPQKLVVHEWGTFLGVQGSDGTTLGGIIVDSGKFRWAENSERIFLYSVYLHKKSPLVEKHAASKYPVEPTVWNNMTVFEPERDGVEVFTRTLNRVNAGPPTNASLNTRPCSFP